jgi:hypothetical protein
MWIDEVKTKLLRDQIDLQRREKRNNEKEMNLSNEVKRLT